MRIHGIGLNVTITYPRGGILAKGAISSGAAYTEVCSRTVPANKTLQLAKIVVSVVTPTWICYYWNGAAISCERLLDAKTVLIEHFPWDWYAMAGDGSKKFQIMARYETAAGTVNGEISGGES